MSLRLVLLRPRRQVSPTARLIWRRAREEPDLLSVDEFQLKTRRYDEATVASRRQSHLAARLQEVLAAATGYQLLARFHERAGKLRAV